jgi:hypothetical protein
MVVKRRLRYLERVQLIQDEYSKYDDGSRSIATIYRLWIEPKFKVSQKTLSTMLAINIKKEIKELSNNQ